MIEIIPKKRVFLPKFCIDRLFHKSPGFTLIELMIVVVIIGIITAIVIPKIASYRAKSEKESAVQDISERKPAPEKTVHRKTPSVTPVATSADINIKLAARNAIHGLSVFTLFDASFNGTFIFENTSTELNTIRLYFPFPDETARAQNASLKLRNESGQFIEPENVIYSLKGIKWFGELSKGDRLTAKVTYGAQGYKRFLYQGPGAGRAGNFKLRLNVEGVTSEFIPPNALQPSDVKPGMIIWDYQNLITDRQIIVELPGAMSPLGRIVLFLRLAGFAVFLFGSGFWYLSELNKPGSLDDFRWAHFFLLALTFSLFFVIYTFLSLGGDIKPFLAMVISAALSFPLLLLHVSKFMDTRFALKSVLPLAVFSLGIVISGVYGGDHRKYIFIGAIVIVLGFVTFTYKSWSERRKEHFEDKKEKAKAREESKKLRKFWQEEAGKSLKKVKKELDAAEKLIDSSTKLMESVTGLSDLKKGVEVTCLALKEIRFESNEIVCDISTKLENVSSVADNDEHKNRCQEWMDSAIEYGARLETQIQILRESSETLQKARNEEKAENERARQAVSERRQFWEKETAKAVDTAHVMLQYAENTEIKAARLIDTTDAETGGEARKTVEENAIVLADLRFKCTESYYDNQKRLNKLSEISDNAQHKSVCREVMAQSKGISDKLIKASELLDEHMKKLLSFQDPKKAVVTKTRGKQFCIHCGAPDQMSRYCSECGRTRQLELTCSQCHDVTRIPRYLLDMERDFSSEKLYCPECGNRHAYTFKKTGKRKQPGEIQQLIDALLSRGSGVKQEDG